MHTALFGLKELAELHGISKQAMYQRINTKSYYEESNFPEPAYVVSCGKLWTYEQIWDRVKKSNYGESEYVLKKLQNMVNKTEVGS